MKDIVFALVLLITSPLAAGKDSTPTPSGTNVSSEMTVQSCHFKMADKFGGSILRPRAENDFKFAGYSATITSGSKSREFGFSLGCSDGVANANDIAAKNGATYDAKKKKWVAYFGDVSKEDADLLRPVTRVGPLDAVNGHGFYLTQDDTDGDLPRRTRSLTYCLFHDNKALCGHGQVMKLSDPKGNLLPYALTILRSIEFIDTPAPAATSDKP